MLSKNRAEWSPRYIPETLLREAAMRLQDRFLFGSDYPFITPQRWMKDFEVVKIAFKPEVREKLFWRNGQKLLWHVRVWDRCASPHNRARLPLHLALDQILPSRDPVDIMGVPSELRNEMSTKRPKSSLKTLKYSTLPPK